MAPLRRQSSGAFTPETKWLHSGENSHPGKPTDNCHIETFNGSFRDECLNLHWFATLEEAKAIIEAWRQVYNESRPHSTLNNLPPAEFARRVGLPASASA